MKSFWKKLVRVNDLDPELFDPNRVLPLKVETSRDPHSTSRVLLEIRTNDVVWIYLDRARFVL